MNEEQLKEIKKVKLIYTIELAIICVVFLTIAILELTGALTISERHHIIFNFVTLAGGTWLIVDFIWTLKSKKRREKNSMLDKALALPLGIYLITFDIICLVNWNALPYEAYLYGMTSAFFYIVLIYGFEAIYHYKHPLVSLVQAALQDLEDKKAKEEAMKEKANEENGDQKEENDEQEKQDN